MTGLINHSSILSSRKMDSNKDSYGSLNENTIDVNIQVEKKPKKIIYCSNGTIEQYDDDDENDGLNSCKRKIKTGETSKDSTGPLLLVCS